MESLLASGRLIDLILAATVLEFLLLTLWRRRSGHGVPPAELALDLAAGAALLLALRGALTGAQWTWIAACLTLALVAHLLHLARRWR
jgi:hypothetical protein